MPSFLIPDSFGTDLVEFNTHHVPGGSPQGGQFASAEGGGSSATRAYKSQGERDAAEGRIYRATPESFKQALERNPFAETLTNYSLKDLRQMRLYMLKGGRAGYAIKKNGELVSVFNHGGEASKGAGAWLVLHAIEHGARHGDHFDGKYLTPFYKNLGFVHVKREKNWTPGGDDVIYMKWGGGDVSTARARYRRDGHLNVSGLREARRQHAYVGRSRDPGDGRATWRGMGPCPA